MTIYSCFTGKTDEQIEAEFAGKGYGDFKTAVGEACAAELGPIQERYKKLLADKAYLESVMKNNSARAAYLARKTLSKVYRKIGFTSV
jgi:tryptophanyl-tRNA synthetase